ncbi:MAG: DeoR/GlpR transcriptional regulator [Clostridia bacterium]|nr:DeoR/GlpR transcriptional regulator [Clostridia bacterium]
MNERQDRIYEIILRTGNATVEQLQSEVYASPATIRRDLKVMEEEGVISRVWGGAVVNKSGVDKPVFVRSVENVEPKKAIAKKALRFISDNDTIFLSSSTTVEQLCRLLYRYTDLTVITNCLDFVDIIRKSLSFKVFLPAGQLHERHDLVGPLAVNSIEKFNANVFFFSCSGIDENGFTSNDIERLEIFSAMAKNSVKTVLLCDCSKVDKVATYRGFGFDKIDFVIMDETPKNEQLVKTLGNKLIVCND